MQSILVIFLIVMWIFSYTKFKRKINYFKIIVGCLLRAVSSNPTDPMLQLRLASALSEIQHYKDAYDIYNGLLNQGSSVPNLDKIKINMEFCKNPMPGSVLKNHNSSWLHNFLLARFGKRRFNFLTEQDFLLANSILRNQ